MAEDEFALTLSLDVAAPINRVWQLMTDIDSWPSWHPLLEAVEDEVVAGGTIVTKMRSGAELSAYVVGAVLDEPEHFEYIAGDPAGVIGWHCWTVTELGPRRTRADNRQGLSGPADGNLTDEMRAGIAARQQAICATFKEAAEWNSSA